MVVDLGSHANYLAVESGTIVLNSQSMEDEGEYEIEVRAYFEDYPNVSRTETFFARINPCQVDEFSIKRSDISIEIGTGALQSAPYSPIFVPSKCNKHQMTADFVGLPDFVTSMGNALIVDSVDKQNAGAYTVDLLVTLQVPTDHSRTRFVEM